MCCLGDVQLASPVMQGEGGERSGLSSMGDFQGLHPQQGTTSLPVNAKNKFPVNSQQVGVNGTRPCWFGWYDAQDFSLVPSQGFALLHHSHRAEVEAAPDLFEFHGSVLPTCRSIVQTHLPVVRQFCG